MWTPVQTTGRVSEDEFENCEEAPSSRAKHAACATADGHIYLMGGRSGTRPLKDLWRLDPSQNTWEEVKCWGDHPPNLQEHTMVAWKDKLYIFGGEVGFSTTTDTSLWILDLGTCIWRQGNSGPTRSKPGTVMQPSGRRAHSAVLYKDSMHIYGGYQDLRGSSSELWSFNLGLEQWHLVSCSLRCADQPSPRHSHSAVIHDNCMWIYGGMTNLEEKGDFWKWNFELSQWSKVKCNKAPGNLHSHSAIKAFGCMFIFGGERNGQLLQDLWRYHFGSNCWEKINVVGLMPNPRCRHIAIANPTLDTTSWDQEEYETYHKSISRTQSKSSYVLSKSTSKSTNLLPPKSISMCFGSNQIQETPLHQPNNLNQSKGTANNTCNDPSNNSNKTSVNNNLNQSNSSSKGNNTNKTSRTKVKSAKFRVKLCSKESVTLSDEEEHNQDPDENDENGVNNGQDKKTNPRKSLKDKISSSRLVRSISSSSYNILHNRANGYQESERRRSKIEVENLIVQSSDVNDKSMLNGTENRNNVNGNGTKNELNGSGGNKRRNNHRHPLPQQQNSFGEEEEEEEFLDDPVDGGTELECDLDMLKMSKSQSSEPVLETHYDFVIRKRIEGALRYGAKVRPKSEVLEGLFHLESLLEHGEYDVPPSSSAGPCNAGCTGGRECKNRMINKRHTVSESMSYYSLCFPSPPFGRRVETPPETSPDTPNGSSLNEDEDTSSTSMNRDNGSSSSQSNGEKGDYNKIMIDGDSMIIETHSREPSSMQSQQYATANTAMTNSTASTATISNPQSIHFDDHFYKALASPADVTGTRTSGYNSSATLYTPSSESQGGLPHSMSHSSGYHSFTEDSFDPPSSSSAYNPFHHHHHPYPQVPPPLPPHQGAHYHHPTSALSFVPRRQPRIPRDSASFELKQLTNIPNRSATTEAPNGFNVRLNKDIRLRARERASHLGQCNQNVSSIAPNNHTQNNLKDEPTTLNNKSINNHKKNKDTLTSNQDSRLLNVMKEVGFSSSPASRKWAAYSPARSKVHQRHWQLCMYVLGGKEQSSSQPMYKQPISVWKFHI